MSCPRLVVAGTQSGTGKTSLVLGLAHALKRRGARVQTFKAGPDFLDPTYLALASGHPCYNLDGWMMGVEYVCHLFARASSGADIAIIEGAMGLFDGADWGNSEGSTAELARWLDAPVLLVVDVHGMARSIAAIVEGFCGFEQGVRLAGVVANQCGSDRHRQWLAEALLSANLPPLVGAIPRGTLPVLPSRHLGLVTASVETLPASTMDVLADAFEKYVDMEAILRLAGLAGSLTAPPASETQHPKRARLGVARDSAFHFYYTDNLESLQRAGCELAFFSPVSDSKLPEGLDALYIGGGYPESHAEELAANRGMLAAVRAFIGSERPVYAECGGLLYLTRYLETVDGKRWNLAGVLPLEARMLKRRKVLGYAEVVLTANSIWGQRGESLRGHEFHYSELLPHDSVLDGWERPYGLRYRRNSEAVPEGYQRGVVLASYIHAHFASRPAAVAHIIDVCRRQR